MRRTAFLSVMVVAGMLLTGPGIAQDLPDRREAIRSVFPADAEVETVVFPHPSLSQPEIDLLSGAVAQGLLPDMLFYGSIAIAPDQGLSDPATTTAVGNFHDANAADAAALARCDDARDGGAPCVIVLQVRPAGWAEGAPLQLSSGAAEALRSEFRRGVFSISASTGNFGYGADQTEADAACNAPDCQPVIAN